MLFEEITRALTHWFLTRVLLVHFPLIPFIDAVIWISLAFFLGAVMTYIVKKLPYFSRLI